MPNKPNIKVGVEIDQNDVKRELSGLETQFNSAGSSITSAFSGTKMGQVTNSLKGIGSKGALAAAGVSALAAAAVAAAGALTKITAENIALAKSLDLVANNSGVAGDAVGAVATAFVQAGSDTDRAGDFIQDFVERLGDARAGNEGLRESFNALGVDINQTTTGALEDTIEALTKTGDKAEQLFRGVELFGDAYKDVASTMSELDRDNTLFSEEYIEASGRLNTSLNLLETNATSLWNQLTTPLIGGLSDLLYSSLGLEEIAKADFATAGLAVAELTTALAGQRSELTALESELNRNIPTLAEWAEEVGYGAISQHNFTAAQERYNETFNINTEELKDNTEITKANIALIEERIRFLNNQKITVNESSNATVINTEANEDNAESIEGIAISTVSLTNALIELTNVGSAASDQMNTIGEANYSGSDPFNAILSNIGVLEKRLGSALTNEDWIDPNTLWVNWSDLTKYNFNALSRAWTEASAVGISNDPFDEDFLESGASKYISTLAEFYRDAQLTNVEGWLAFAESAAIPDGVEITSENVAELGRMYDDAFANVFGELEPSVKEQIRELMDNSLEGITGQVGDIKGSTSVLGMLFKFDSEEEALFTGALEATRSFTNDMMDMIGSISDYRVAKLEYENEQANKAAKKELKNFKGNSKAKQSLEDKFAAEQEAREDAINEKKKKMQIANTWVGALSSIPGIWGGYAQAFAPFGMAAPALIAGFGGATTAMVLGSAAAQSAAIAKYEEGGFVGGMNGGSQGPDTEHALLGKNEYVMTVADQKNFLRNVKGNAFTGSSGTINITQGSITIEGNATEDTLDSIRQVNDQFLYEIKDAVNSLYESGELQFS